MQEEELRQRLHGAAQLDESTRMLQLAGCIQRGGQRNVPLLSSVPRPNNSRLVLATS